MSALLVGVVALAAYMVVGLLVARGIVGFLRTIGDTVNDDFIFLAIVLWPLMVVVVPLRLVFEVAMDRIRKWIDG